MLATFALAAARGCGLVVSLSLLAGAAAAQDVTRIAEFQYDTNSGQLILERVDPGSSHCVETSYTLDNFGNRERVEVRPCGTTSPTFTARVTVNGFEPSTDAANPHPAGAYLTRTRSGFGAFTALAEARSTFDTRFGAPLKQTEVALEVANGTRDITKRVEYDTLGRVAREYVPVKRDANNQLIETAVEHTRVHCLGPKVLGPANAACLRLTSVNVPVTYASKRLVDSAGALTTVARVPLLSAYFVETTPLSGATVIGAKSRVHYDALHRQIATETQAYDGRWVRTLTGHDALGNVAATWGAHSVDAAQPQTLPPDEMRQWTSERDTLHRPTAQTQSWRPDATTASQPIVARMRYEGLKSTATVPDSVPNGVTRTAVTYKNAVGQTAQTVNADGATLNMAYDAVGNLVKTVDALNFSTSIFYTSGTARFKARMVDPDQGEWLYTYDALGQLRAQVDGRGKTLRMEYDTLGRLTAKLSDQLNAHWSYGKDETGVPCASGLNRLCVSKTGNATTAEVTRQSTTYDSLGRAVTASTKLDREYISRSSFDDRGRLATVTYPTGLYVNYAYSDMSGGRTPGVLHQVTSTDTANVTREVWRIDSVTPASDVFDAHGHLRKAQLGNGALVNNTFDPISGKAFALRSGAGGTGTLLDQLYVYDKADNLKKRTEQNTGVVEEFLYDVLDRLTQYKVMSASDAVATRTIDIRYNALGNVLEKGDVGGYAYVASRPHAVSSAGGTNYTYDGNGNVIQTAGVQARTQTWTDFNAPDTLIYQGKSVAFTYDAGYKRVREVTTGGGSVRTLYLIHSDNAGGLGYEREETRVGGSLVRDENRHYISVAGTVVAVVKTLNTGTTLNGTISSDASMTQYWHKDSLGSVVAVSNASGAMIERMAFDAWGRRQRAGGRADPWIDPANGDRGYTGHEHLDELALVHMNGRVYDPLLARFLSADPILQAPGDLQNHNRYSYVLNNPLRYTDPSGNVIEWLAAAKVFAAVAAVAMIADGNKHWKLVGTVTLAWALPGVIEAGLGNTAELAAALKTAPGLAASTFNIGGLGNAILSGAVVGAAAGGDVESALVSGFTAGAFTTVGASLEGARLVAAHALIGCVSQAASGGKCGPGAAAAGFAKLATPTGPINIVTVTLVGGTASVIGGGKFANGAVTAAMGYLFNQMTQAGRILNGATRRPGDVLICRSTNECFYVPPAAAAAAAAAVNLGHNDISMTHPTVEQIGQGLSAGGLALSAGGVASGYVPAIAAGGGLQVTGAAFEFFGRPSSSNALSLATEIATDRIPAVRFGAGVGLGVSAMRFGVSALPVGTPPQLSDLNVP